MKPLHLCRYVRHLSMIDYCCFASTLEGRICESTTHLHEFFEDEVTFSKDERGHIRYVVRRPSHHPSSHHVHSCRCTGKCEPGHPC
jgi:hypothetical protein